MTLRKYKVPVTIRELLDLLTGLKEQLVYANIDDFYLLSRTAMVKDEKDYDKFDRAFSAYFKGLDDLHGLLESLNAERRAGLVVSPFLVSRPAWLVGSDAACGSRAAA